MKEGKVHKIQGKGSFVIRKCKKNLSARLIHETPVALCMQSYLAPFIAKTLSGWDDYMLREHSRYIIHGFIQPHQQFDILRGLRDKVNVIAIHFLPWTRKALSPMPILEEFGGTVLFLLDRHYEYPGLGYAVINDESKGLELAFNYISSKMQPSSQLIYFHRRNSLFQSIRTRSVIVPQVADRYGIDCETVNLSFRIRNKLKAFFCGRRKHVYAICSDAALADDILYTCSELGIRHGDNLTLVSLFESGTSLRIPHVSVDFYSIGKKAASIATDIQKGEYPARKTMLVSPSFSIM